MRRPFVSALAVTLAFACAPAAAQQRLPDAQRPPATFDAGAIRRQAAQLAEFRALLADPDANVRLLVMREAIRTGDAIQRQIAIEAGLASSEATMVEAAVRGVLSNVQQIIIEFVDNEGKFITEGNVASLRLTVVQFDSESGRINGTTACASNPKWSGQFQGSVLVFNTDNSYCSGILTWIGESGDFRGRVNITGGDSSGNRTALWKPR